MLIFYVLRGGCQWRLLPKDLPPYQTVYDYFRSCRLLGTWERIHDRLRGDVREAHGPGAKRWNYRQSNGKDNRKGGIRGYDGSKRILGRKRHIVVDVLGLLLIP